jgi:hypothetical protein
MIERRRLFFGSDILRDITQPSLSSELLCSLHVHYQETMESRLPNETVILTGRTMPNRYPNWHYRNSLTGSCALCHIRVFDLLCLSNQLGLV